jgi:uncharacterized membrane protein
MNGSVQCSLHTPHSYTWVCCCRRCCYAGPATVAGMAAAKGWPSVLVPVILTSTLGYAIGTFIGTGLGYGLLRRMC